MLSRKHTFDKLLPFWRSRDQESIFRYSIFFFLFLSKWIQILNIGYRYLNQIPNNKQDQKTSNTDVCFRWGAISQKNYYFWLSQAEFFGILLEARSVMLQKICVRISNWVKERLSGYVSIEGKRKTDKDTVTSLQGLGGRDYKGWVEECTLTRVGWKRNISEGWRTSR